MAYIDNKNWIKSQLRKGLFSTVLVLLMNIPGTLVGADDELDAYALEDFVVTTGSYIPELVGSNFASPVAQVTSEYIEDTGLSSNLLEVLRKSVPQFYGNKNLGRSSADLSANRNGGGSKIGLRNTQTLVLINGRRVAFSPIVAAYGDYFVDLNMIPVSAVNKIEILKDGASATYGTDATSGVVNIILKNEYDGLEVGGRYGVSSNEGNWEERRFNFTGGVIEENFRFMVSGEWYKADPLWHNERDFAQPKYGGQDFGGKLYGPDFQMYVLNPELDAPPMGTKVSIVDAVAQGIYLPVNNEKDLTYGRGVDQPLSIDLSDHVTLLTADERKSLVSSFEFDLNEKMIFFSDLIITQSDSFSQVAAQGVALFNYDSDGFPIEVVLPDHPNNPFDGMALVYNRFLEYPRQRYYDTKTIRLVSGLKGKLENGFGYEVAALYNKAETDYRRTGLYDAAGHARILEMAGINPGAGPGDTPVINPFSRVHTPGVLDDVFGAAWGVFESDLRQVDARIFGNLITLPAGELQFALGTEYREERLDVDADANTIAHAWYSGDFIVPFSKERNVASFYLELKAPLIGEEMGLAGIHSLDLELSARHERYSDTSDPTVPKVALIWEPVDDSLFFRATYSESFNAPDLFMLNAPEIAGVSGNIYAYPFVGADLNNPPPFWGEPNVRSKGNALLEPGESDSQTIGFVWQPKLIKGFTVEMDYYRIRERGTPGFVAESTMVQDVELNGPDSQYASLVRIGSYDGNTVSAPGELLTYSPNDVYITSPLLNVFEQTISGVDVTLNYVYEVNESTNLLVRSSMARVLQFDTQVTYGSEAIETEGQATALNGTIPDYRIYSVINLKHKNMGLTLGHSYIPSMPYENAPVGKNMESYSTFDLSASYTFKAGAAEGLRILVGVNNVTNEMPPLAPELFGDANADIATYDPTGRVFFIETSYTF